MYNYKIVSSKYAAEQLSWAILKAVLNILAATGKLTVGQLYKALLKKLDTPQRNQLSKKGGENEFRRVIYYMTRKKFISRPAKRGEGVDLSITSLGRHKLANMQFEPLKLDPKTNWDGRWRILSFDIPEEYRLARDALRRLIKDLGFKQLHKSVWVHPLPCRAQVEDIKKAYGVNSRHISLLEVQIFDQDQHFQRLFKKELGLYQNI